MSIKEQLMADMKTAMKAREEGKLALNTIRMARAHIRQAEIDDGHADFNDDQVLAVLRKEVKQRKETLVPEEKTWLNRPKRKSKYWRSTCRQKCLQKK